MISHIENNVTGLLDRMHSKDIKYLLLETGHIPYYVSASVPVSVSGSPGADIVNIDELVEDLEALSIHLIPEGEYYYRHAMEDPALSDMRMKVTCCTKYNGEYLVTFRKLEDGEAARPSKGKKFVPSAVPPSNAYRELQMDNSPGK